MQQHFLFGGGYVTFLLRVPQLGLPTPSATPTREKRQRTDPSEPTNKLTHSTRVFFITRPIRLWIEANGDSTLLSTKQ